MKELCIIIWLIPLLVFLLVVGNYMFNYLSGEYSIKSIEEVDKKIYLGRPKINGVETITYIVYKVTYESGRIEFTTKEYRF